MCRKLIYSICLVLVSGWVLTSGAQAADPSLVGWWKLDETSGLTAADSSGNGNHGTLTNLPGDRWAKGIKDGGLDFISPGFVNCGTGSSLNVTTDFTLAAWVKLAPNTAGNYGGIAGRLLRSGDPYTGFALVRHSSDVFRLWVGDNTGDLAKSAVSSNKTYTDTAWHHVLGLRKGGTNYLYVDGVKQTATTTYPFVPSTDFFHIGRQYSHLDDRYFIGIIDDVRLYNRALTDQEIGALAFYAKAHSPDPSDGAQNIGMPAILYWTPGTTGALHDVYFGTNPTPGPAEYKGRQTLTLYFYPGYLTPGATYYWRIDEVEADGVTIHTGDVWSFTAAPSTAWNPNPSDGGKWVATDAVLSWSAGMTATKHDVYFGTNQADVANGTGGTLKSSQQGTKTYNPGAMALDTTYYWRIDEYDAAGTKYPGKVWGFTTIGANAGIRGYYFNNMNVSGAPVLVRIDPTINFNWGDPGSPDPVVNVDQFSVRWVGVVEALYTEPYIFTCNTDDGFRMWLDEVLVIDSWVPQSPTLHSTAPINLVAGQRYAVRVEYYEDGGGAVAQLYWQSRSTPRQIIPAGALQLPLAAFNPTPPNGASDVKQTPTLRWKAGEKALKHNVYFGADATAVANATTASTSIYRGQQDLAAKSYVPSEAPLAWNATYYWRIDEVNGVNIWKGSTWSFTTADFIVVDDFEDYTDDVGSRIFQTWRDGLGYTEPPPGYGGNGTGSAVGNPQPPYAEQTTVHDGRQSMPLGYDNSGAAGKARYSETQREWASPQDWTVKNLKALTMYFYGDPANAAEQLYVALEDNAGHVKVVNCPDVEAVRAAGWQEWNIELTQFAGVNLAAIKKMYIGLGSRASPTAGGTGTIHIDDIGVHPARCVPSMGKPAADLSGNCIVDAADVDILADLWLSSGFQITPVNPGTTGLVAQYPFNGNANDVIGGHNGSTSGLPAYTTGKTGQAILFDGVDDYVATKESLLSNLTKFTLAGWVRPGNPAGSRIGLFGQNDAVEFGFDGGSISIWTAGGGSTSRAWPFGVLTWHHVATVGDGTNLKIYVDGQPVATGGSATANYGTSTFGFNIGGGGVWDADGNWFSGKIDEVYVYNRALSGAEVAWLAGYTSPLSIPADLRQDGKIDFKDFAVLADSWLEQLFWP